MGVCSARPVSDEDRRSDQIDKKIGDWKKSEQMMIKILLLGVFSASCLVNCLSCTRMLASRCITINLFQACSQCAMVVRYFNSAGVYSDF